MKNNFFALLGEMRSDFKDNSDTFNKMIQFGTVKYGIVKQLKDRTRSERDVTSDQEEIGSCSPSCKSNSPDIQMQSQHSPAADADDKIDATITAGASVAAFNLADTQTMLDNHHPMHHHLNPFSHLSNHNSLNNHLEDHNHNTNNLMAPLDGNDGHHHHLASQSEVMGGLKGEQHTYLQEIERINTKLPSPTPPDLEINNQPLDRRTPEVALSEETVKELQQESEKTDESEDLPVAVEEPQETEKTVAMSVDPEPQRVPTPAAAETADKPNEEDCAEEENPSSRSPPASSSPMQMPQFPAPGPVTLEAIQNMQMAIAQFAAKTIANGNAGADNEAAMKQLAFLQQTLFNLQQQQLFQIQLIQQLQSQLAMNQGGKSENEGEEENEEADQEQERERETNQDDDDQELEPGEIQVKRERLDDDVHCQDEEMQASNHSESNNNESLKRKREEYDEYSRNNSLQMMASMKQDENMPLPFGNDLASSIITNHDDLPSLDEPNSLEMLQRRAQEVLDSASQGILANNLADEYAFGKDGKTADGKSRNEPFFKHRCRYCGKVFGSDSALQIHIRSHTGERPFKCNVCGSRFTTKGNLKVHFQRHAHKFPHIPMNATPIPEHLDKFHPPLLEQMSPDSSPTHQPQMPQQMPPVSLPLPFPPNAGYPGLPGLYRPPLDILKSLGPYPNPFFPTLPHLPPAMAAALKRDQDLPTDLRKPSPPNTPEQVKESEPEQERPVNPRSVTPQSQPPVEEPLSLKIKQEKIQDENEQSRDSDRVASPPLTAPDMPVPIPAPVTQVSPPTPIISVRPLAPPTPPTPTKSALPPVMQPQQPAIHPQPSPGPIPPPNIELLPTPGQLPPPFHRDEFFADRFPLNFTRTSPDRRSPIRSPASIPRSPFFGAAMKHEMALLPRPHSNDNSWENFIEVSNTSETLKLKEMMKNKKLTDPNQCVVCDRVLSCKSALQMHYRTHTGERPFKCRICGRAFTTKGNLKTHMAVHKIRPPMRNFHQCPVCHKKYSNALVLQQHIRLHTGEPTDLTPEQIQAAEIRDPPPSMMPGAFLNPFAFHFGAMGPGGPHNGAMGSESSQGDMDDNMDCSDDFDDDVSSEHMSSIHDESMDRPKSGDDMKGMLFEQKLKIEANTSSVPTSPVESNSINKPPASPEDSSGALDLTPRSQLSQQAPAPAPVKIPTPPTPPQANNQTQPPQAQQQQPPPQPPPLPQQHSPLAPSHPNMFLHHQQHLHQQLQHHHHQQQQHQQHLHQQRQQQEAAAQQQSQQQLQQQQSQQHHGLQPPPPPQPNPAMMSARPPFGMFPNIPLFPPATTQNMCTAMNSIAQSVMPAAPFNPLALSGVRGSTTCGICFKTFPCHSALEIHYRSHTKERPFKCSICDRGFTTKGNLKQHMLTHKIRDMEQETFRNRAVKYMSGWKEEYE